MDSYTYFNLFETKGIEYLIIIGFLILIIPFWIWLNRPVKTTGMLKKDLVSLAEGLIRIPRGLFFCRNHTWTYLEKDGNAKVGLDGLLLRITGEVNVDSIKMTGDRISKGEKLASISHEGKSIDITSPIAGEIIAVNSMLSEEPGIQNIDPYGQGWICRIKPSSWKEEINSFHLADEASEWLGRELVRVRDFIAGSVKKYSPELSPVYLQDGGELADGVLQDMPQEIWSDFQNEFLK